MNKELVGKLRKYTGQPIADCKRVLDSVKPELAQHYVKYYENHSGTTFIDPQEVDPGLIEIFKKVDDEISLFMEKWEKERTSRIKGTEIEFMGLRGSCHIAWSEKQRILEECYDIKWSSPVKMNPNVVFD